MLCSILQLSPIAQLPLAQAGQLLLVAGISFVIITLIASTYRFHKMIQLSVEDLITIEDCNNFFFVQVTRYLSKINRTTSGFGILIVQFCAAESDKRNVQEGLFSGLKGVVRHVTDKVCLFGDDCVAAIIDTEEDRVAEVTCRMMEDLKKIKASNPGATAFRVGVSSFPTHGFHTKTIIDTAVGALETVSFENPRPFCIAPAPDSEMENEDTPGKVGELIQQDKVASLDPLTGVLKPAVIATFMRKYLSEIRLKKQPAALLCVGISRIDQIIKMHGETAADDVIAGVSNVLQRLTRDCDLIGRYHRDDFLILLPCTLQQGEMIATRLREAVQKEVFISGSKRIKTAVAIGITGHPEHGRNLRDLFSRAYRALEVLRDWNTAACLVYDAAQHAKKDPAKKSRV